MNREKFETTKNKYFFQALINFWKPSIEDGNIPLWMEYALATNERGRDIASTVEKHTQIKDSTYLDTGFSYGGCLVAFAEKKAACYGFELDKDIFTIAKENFKDNNINPAIYIKNIEENPDEKFKNFFNIITCNHVLEHVNDPRRAVLNIASMLCYKGTAYFEIPNRYYPPCVLKDEHTSLFAITLLEREEALTYYKTVHPESIYRVGHYLAIDTYMDLFKASGLMPVILDETFRDYRNDKILDTVEEIKHAGDMIPEGVKKMIQIKVRSYLKNFSDTLKHDEKKFILHYGVPCWKILCRKS